jgi:hypothetical protein
MYGVTNKETDTAQAMKILGENRSGNLNTKRANPKRTRAVVIKPTRRMQLESIRQAWPTSPQRLGA